MWFVAAAQKYTVIVRGRDSYGLAVGVALGGTLPLTLPSLSHANPTKIDVLKALRAWFVLGAAKAVGRSGPEPELFTVAGMVRRTLI